MNNKKLLRFVIKGLLHVIFDKLIKNVSLQSVYLKIYFRGISKDKICGIRIPKFLREPNELANELINLLRECYDPIDKRMCYLIISIIRLIIHEPKRHNGLNTSCLGYQNIISVEPEPPDSFLNILGYLSLLGSITTASINIPSTYIKSFSNLFFNREEYLIEKLKNIIIKMEEINEELENSSLINHLLNDSNHLLET